MFPNSFLIYHWVRVEATNAQGSSTASLVLGLPMLMLAESAAISYLGNIVIFCNPLKGGVPIKRRCLLTFQGPCIGPSPRYIYIYNNLYMYISEVGGVRTKWPQPGKGTVRPLYMCFVVGRRGLSVVDVSYSLCSKWLGGHMSCF